MRHKGFIPWDDDIDIAMTAAGLEQFKAVAPGELPPYLFLQTPETDDNKEPINKVRNLKHLLKGRQAAKSLSQSKKAAILS